MRRFLHQLWCVPTTFHGGGNLRAILNFSEQPVAHRHLTSGSRETPLHTGAYEIDILVHGYPGHAPGVPRERPGNIDLQRRSNVPN